MKTVILIQVIYKINCGMATEPIPGKMETFIKVYFQRIIGLAKVE